MASPTLRSNVFSRCTGLIIEGRTARLDFCGLQSNGGHMDDDRNAPVSKGDDVEWGTRTIETLTKVIRDSQAEIVKAFSVCVETVQTQLKARTTPMPVSLRVSLSWKSGFSKSKGG